MVPCAVRPCAGACDLRRGLCLQSPSGNRSYRGRHLCANARVPRAIPLSPLRLLRQSAGIPTTVSASTGSCSSRNGRTSCPFYNEGIYATTTMRSALFRGLCAPIPTGHIAPMSLPAVCPRPTSQSAQSPVSCHTLSIFPQASSSLLLILLLHPYLSANLTHSIHIYIIIPASIYAAAGNCKILSPYRRYCYRCHSQTRYSD